MTLPSLRLKILAFLALCPVCLPFGSQSFATFRASPFSPSLRTSSSAPILSALAPRPALSLESSAHSQLRSPRAFTRGRASCLSLASKKETEDATKGSKKVKSPITGRFININGPAYHKVIELGYVLFDGELIHKNCVEEEKEKRKKNKGANDPHRQTANGVKRTPMSSDSTEIGEMLKKATGEEDIKRIWSEMEKYTTTIPKSANPAEGEAQLRAIFDGMKDDTGRVHLVDLRVALMAIDVTQSARLFWDLLLAADAEGKVTLEYDGFVDLLVRVQSQDDVAIDEESSLSYFDDSEEGESFNPDWNTMININAGGSMMEIEGEKFRLAKELNLSPPQNTQGYLEGLGEGFEGGFAEARQTNWDLLAEYHCGEWHGVWTVYPVIVGGLQEATSLDLQNRIEFVPDDAMSRIRAISSVQVSESDFNSRKSNGPSIKFSDKFFGDWVTGSLDMDPAGVREIFGFFDKAVTLSPRNQQSLHIKQTYMHSARRGSSWCIEGAVSMGNVRHRTVLIYKDHRTAEKGELCLLLTQILTINEYKDDFPSTTLEKLWNGPVSDEELKSRGKWLGLVFDREQDETDVCPTDGASEHTFIRWKGHNTFGKSTKNRVFALPNGAFASAPIQLWVQQDATEPFRVSMTWVCDDDVPAESRMCRITREIDPATVLPLTYAEHANQYRSQRLEDFYLYERFP